MFENLAAVNPGALIALVAILSGALIALVAVLAGNWAGVRRAEVEASLKQDMLNRGLSAADIERILRASSQSPEPPPQTDPISDNEYYIVEKMLDEEKSVEDIERIIRAFKGPSAQHHGCAEDPGRSHVLSLPGLRGAAAGARRPGGRSPAAGAWVRGPSACRCSRTCR
jgi:hypothetical protein